MESRGETAHTKHNYSMRTFDEETATVLQEWTEREFRAAVGAKPRCSTLEHNEYDPRGPHRWFAEAVADLSTIVAMRRMAETWRVSPPYLSWRSCASSIRQKADEMVLAAMLPPGTTLVEWFGANELVLQQNPTRRELTMVVAVALLPLFEQQPDCWEAMEWLDDDTCGTFLEYLADWHARVPEKHRSFVRQIAQEFGLEISGDK